MAIIQCSDILPGPTIYGALADTSCLSVTPVHYTVAYVDGARNADAKFRGDTVANSTAYAVGDFVCFGATVAVCTVAGTSGTYSLLATHRAAHAYNLINTTFTTGTATFIIRGCYSWATAAPVTMYSTASNAVARLDFNCSAPVTGGNAFSFIGAYVASSTAHTAAAGALFGGGGGYGLAVSVDKTVPTLSTFAAGASIRSTGSTVVSPPVYTSCRGMTFGASVAATSTSTNNGSLYSAYAVLYDCTMYQNMTDNTTWSVGGLSHFVGGSIHNMATSTNTKPFLKSTTTLERVTLTMASAGQPLFDAEGSGVSYGVDFSGAASAPMAASTNNTYTNGPKIVGSALSATNTTYVEVPSSLGRFVTGALVNCSVGTTPYGVYRARPKPHLIELGAMEVPNNAVYKVGGAADRQGSFSVQTRLNIFESVMARVVFHNSKLDESFYVYVDVLHVRNDLSTLGVPLHREDIWLEAIYSGSSTTWESAYACSLPRGEDRKGILHASGAPDPLTVSPASWVGGGGGTAYRLKVLVTPKRKGDIVLFVVGGFLAYSRYAAGQDSWTAYDHIYIDPLPGTEGA